MLQAGSDHGHAASSLSLVSGQDQFNPSNPRKSNSACSGKHQQQAGRQAGRPCLRPRPMALASLQLPRYSMTGHLPELG